MEDVIVCRCMNVSAADVIKYTQQYPKWTTDQLSDDLRIGSRCRCCTSSDCRIIDKDFREVLKSVNRGD